MYVRSTSYLVFNCQLELTLLSRNSMYEGGIKPLMVKKSRKSRSAEHGKR